MYPPRSTGLCCRLLVAGAPGCAGWALEGDAVRVPHNEANDPQPQQGAERISFAKLEGLFKPLKA
jgi:hypothetical protein